MRTLTLQRALVGHAGLAVGYGVVHEQAGLNVLTCVYEVQAVHFSLSAGSGELGGGCHAHQVAAEGHHNVLEACVAAQLSVVCGGVDGVVSPLLDGHDVQLSLVVHHELDVLCEHGGAGVAQNHDGLREGLSLNHDVLGGGLVAGAVDINLNVLGQLGLGGDGHHGCLGEARPGVSRHAILGNTGGADACILTGDGLNLNLLGCGNLRCRCGAGQLLQVQAAQTLQRGEAPILFTAGQRSEVLHVVGGLTLGTGCLQHLLDVVRVGALVVCLGGTVQGVIVGELGGELLALLVHTGDDRGVVTQSFFVGRH